MIGLLIRFFKRNFKLTSSDERIEKEQNSVLIQGYMIAQLIAIIVLGYILISKAPIINLIIPAGVLVICNTYIFIKIKQYGLIFKDFMRGSDEFLITIRNKTFKEGYYIGFYFVMLINIIVVGLMVYQARIGFTSKNIMSFMANYSYSFMIVIISSLYITIRTIKKGLLVGAPNTYMGDNSKGKTTKPDLKKFRIRCVIGALFFGIILGVSSPGHFSILRFLKITILAGGAWGLFFYFAMIGMMKLSSKAANKRAGD